VFAEFFQYIIPAGLIIGTTVGYFKQRQSGALFVSARANPKPAITSMSWRDFERLVGEVFRRQGFVVSGFGGQGPDGGVDLGLTKNAQRYLAQCKHWRKSQVGVTVVRELNGVVSAQSAHGGFVVTGGEFTCEAREFAESCGIKLIDGPTLEKLIAGIPNKESAADSSVAVAVASAPACPRCGLSMVERKATSSSAGLFGDVSSIQSARGSCESHELVPAAQFAHPCHGTWQRIESASNG
jgi:restriction system protein